MAVVSMNGNGLIPGPNVKIERVNQVSQDGTPRQRSYKISISGEMLYWMGSPLADGSFWRLSGQPPDADPIVYPTTTVLEIFGKKMKSMIEIFDQPGELLIQPQNGGNPIRCLIVSSNITFQDPKWNKKLGYNIECEAQDVIFGTAFTTTPSTLAEESWQIDQSDEVGRLFKLTHSVSSFAKKQFDSNGTTTLEGWQVAQTRVLAALGFDQTFLTAAGVLDQSTFLPYNYLRSQQVDKTGGRFSVTESWTCIDPTAASPTGQTTGKAIEDLNIETKYSLDDGLYSVNLNGTITGLEERNPTTRAFIKSRWDNANDRWATITPTILYNLAQSLSGTTLNPLALSTTISKNRVTGVLQYSIGFNNRVGNTDPSYLNEVIEVEFNNAADVFAEIGVINRSAGPILQSIGSTTRKSVTISISITMPSAYGIAPTIPTTNPLAIFLSYVGIPTQVFLASDTPRWNPKTGRYSRSTTYVYQ